MAQRLKTSFKLAKSYTPIYTGGAFAASADGSRLYTTLNDDVVLTEVASGERLHLFQGDTSAVTTLTVSPENATNAGTLAIAYRSLALRFHAVDDFSLTRSVTRAHDAPITIAAADPTGSLIATGSADGVVKVWDAALGHCTHVFRGHGGVVSALFFDVNPSRPPRLVSASDDCRVRLWDLSTRKSLLVLDGHTSVVRGLAVTEDGKTLVSGGRDRVYNVWELPSGKLKQSIPIFETLEGLGITSIPESAATMKASSKGKNKEVASTSRLAVWTAGDSGRVKLWDLATGKQTESTHNAASGLSTAKTHEIVGVQALASTIITAHVDQNIVIQDLSTLRPLKHIIGYNDEVVDALYLTDNSVQQNASETHLAVATNSDLIRIYDLATFDTELLPGHSDVVLCLARNTSGTLLFSGSKDKTARLWRRTKITTESSHVQRSWRCIAVCEGHLESIGAVAITKKNGLIAATASQDKTVKLWDLTPFLDEDDDAFAEDAAPKKAHALTTFKVHDKDINSIDFAPNDRILATGSQDRTAKLFGIDYTPSTKTNPQAIAKLTPLGLLKGHKRGVWSVKFSPTDQCLATASGDRSIKLWNINDFTCLKTLEGHTNTILRIDFLPGGSQLVSCGSDGLVKVWTIKDEDCVATLDNHEDKIWALAASRDSSMLVSGGADSVISFWQDVTEQEEQEKAAADEEEVLKSQDLANYMEVKDYKNAVILALSMGQPRRLLGLLRDVFANEASNAHIIKQVLRDLGPNDIFRLLEYVRDWNARSRDSDIAQAVLNVLLKTHSMASILQATPGNTGLEADGPSSARPPNQDNIEQIIEALIPYTERHYARADRLEQESAFLDFILANMDDYTMPVDDIVAPTINGHGNAIRTNGA